MIKDQRELIKLKPDETYNLLTKEKLDKSYIKKLIEKMVKESQNLWRWNELGTLICGMIILTF